MAHDIYLEQKGQHIVATVRTGALEGLTMTIPTIWSVEQVSGVLRFLIYNSGACVVAFDPWMRHNVQRMGLATQVVPLSPRNASA